MNTKNNSISTVKPTLKTNKSAHIMVTLPQATRKKIEALATKEQRSMAYLCRQFIEQGLNTKKSPTKNKK